MDCDHVTIPATATDTDIIIGEIKSNTFDELLTDSTNVSVHVSHSLPETKTETLLNVRKRTIMPI